MLTFVIALMKQFENGASEAVFSPQDIAELVPDDLFPASKTGAQRASSVGWVVKKFNLATDKLSRSGKGNRYRFEKTKVEKVCGRYFASSPTSPTQALPSLDG